MVSVASQNHHKRKFSSCCQWSDSETPFRGFSLPMMARKSPDYFLQLIDSKFSLFYMALVVVGSAESLGKKRKQCHFVVVVTQKSPFLPLLCIKFQDSFFDSTLSIAVGPSPMKNQQKKIF